MAVIALPFPVTALPGRRPGEGQGDLINVYARKVGNLVRWMKVPGALRWTQSMDNPAPRGQLVVDDNRVLSVWGTFVQLTTASGVTTTLAGALPGTEPVTMARNLHSPVEVVAVADGFAYWVDLDAMAVKPYPLSSVGGTALGAVNSVDYYSGYFAFSRPGGEIFVSNLQTMDFNELSFARAEATPDGLLRMFSAPPLLFACGSDSIEVLQDVGSSPYPYQRVTVMPVGLIGPWAIAGGAQEWDRTVCLVAHDHTVRMLRGVDPIVISNADVSADIEIEARAGRANLLQAQVYTHGDAAVWSLSSPTWTWEHNLSTEAWHRRRSYQPGAQHTDEAVPWRARNLVRFAKHWYAQDALDGGLIEVTSTALDEPSIARISEIDGSPITLRAPLIARCESGAAKELPANIRMPVIYLDFTVGFTVGGISTPAVMLSWSHDGAATWANPVERHLGGIGEFRSLVSLRNTGRSSHQGMRLRWECAEPVPLAFHGALAPTTRASRPRQVNVVGGGE